MDIEVLEEKKEIEISTMKGFLIYRIDILKRNSQNVHSTYISLQGIEYQCLEALQILTPLFNQWGPYSLFFDKLTHFLTQKKDLPKATIVQTKKLINKVKDLNSFFTSKFQAVQRKMKSIAKGVVNYIPPILDDGGALKDWIARSNSFDKIVDHPRFLAYSNNETNVSTIYDIIDMLFRIELNMNKLVGDTKANTDAKWNKCI